MTLVLDDIRLRMAIYFVNSVWQERKGLLLSDDRLMKTAQYKAIDMAIDNYFDHQSPEGIWSNELVRIHGYTLPRRWANDTNNVESIGKGFSAPEGFMEALYVSDDHRPHVTGNVPFFYEHRYFGVGYYKEGLGVPHYVLITAPPELVVEDKDHDLFLPGVYKGRYRLVRVG